MSGLLTLNEAAAIAEVSPDTIRTALEKKSVTPSHRRHVGKAVRHNFSADDVLLIKILTEFPFALSKADKQSLRDLLVRSKKSSGCWSLRGRELAYRCGEMQISIALRPLQRRVARNLALFRWGQRRIVSDPSILGGEAVFRGTRIPLQHVTSLFKQGVPEKEIREDIPHLTARDLEYARLAARFADKPGRPKKRLVFSRAA